MKFDKKYEDFQVLNQDKGEPCFPFNQEEFEGKYTRKSIKNCKLLLISLFTLTLLLEIHCNIFQ